MSSYSLDGVQPKVVRPLIRSPRWRSRYRLACKRGMDIAGSALLMFLLSPVLLLLSVLVLVTSPGPVFYRWRVVGEGGRPFLGYKFRSMMRNADDLKSTLAGQNEMLGPVFKLTHDPRVTPLGKWMRQYSLDELPQL